MKTLTEPRGATIAACVAMGLVLAFAPGTSAQLSKKAQVCVNKLNKDFQKVASKQGKDILKCMKDGSKGKLGAQSIEDCLTADNKGKVGKAKSKTLADAAAKCDTDPNSPDFAAFGPTDPNVVNNVAVQKELDLVHAIFGSNLDATILPGKDPNDPSVKFTSKCQQKVASKVKKCQDAKLKEFNKCKKKGLKNKQTPFTSSTDLETCMFQDPKGKIDKACIAKVDKQVQKQCVLKNVNLGLAFPGLGDPNDVSAELDRIVECLACGALNEVDGLSRDCDEVDDGSVNGSCP